MIGLAVILKNERGLIDDFISRNNLFCLFNEIKFLDGFSTDGSYEYLKRIDDGKLIRIYQRNLNFNFASQRNYLNSLMKSEYICRIDMDEFMSPNLQQFIKQFNGTKDYYTVDRKEIIEKKFREITPQPFIYKNIRTIKWIRAIHEGVIGYSSQQHLGDNLFLIHSKTKERAIRQHCFYWNNWLEHREICRRVDAEKRRKNGLQ